MSVRAPDGPTPEHPGRVEVARVRELAGDLRHGVARAARPERPCREPASPSRRSSPGRHADGVEDLLVPGAAAEVPGERLADLVVASAPGCGAGGLQPQRRTRACRSRTGPRPRRRTPPAPGGARRPRRAPRRSRRRDRPPGRRGRGRSRRARRRGARSTSRTRPARTRSSSPEARAGRAARSGGSRPPRRPSRAARRSRSARSSCEAPLERAAREDAERVTSVRRRCRARRRSGSRPRATCSGKPSASSSGARDEPCRRRRRAEGGAKLAALAVGDERERADGDHHRVARPDLHERLRLPARPNEHARDQLVVRERGPLDADEELGERAAGAFRGRSRPRPRHVRRSSGGSASPAGDAVPRFPPIVPRFRICGDPTVREASASAGSSSRERRASPRCTSARRRAAATRSRATSREAR